MKVEISLKEILVYILRRWKTIIVFASVLAILVVGFSYLKQLPRNKSDVRGNISTTDMNQTTKLSLSIDLSNFIANSPDSYHITLARNDIFARLSDRYMLIIQGARFAEVLRGIIPAGLSEDTLRNIIKVEILGGGLINIIVTGSDGIDSDQVADTIYSYLMSYTEAVSKSVTEHVLTYIAKTSIGDVTKTSSFLDVPGYLMSALIAFIVGIIFATLFSSVIYLILLPIQIPEQIQQRLDIRYIGGVRQKKLYSLADRLAGSLRFISENEGAMDMIYANIDGFLGEHKSILVTGSITEPQLTDFAEKLTSVNKQIGVSFTVGTDINKSASTINSLANCDAVILVESLDKSRLKKINEEKDRIDMSKKEILGYVLY